MAPPSTASAGGAVFSFKDVCVNFGAAEVLREVDLEVASRGITVVSGPSGSGKSTLTRLCNRLLDPTSGSVRFRGVDVGVLMGLDQR